MQQNQIEIEDDQETKDELSDSPMSDLPDEAEPDTAIPIASFNLGSMAKATASSAKAKAKKKPGKKEKEGFSGIEGVSEDMLGTQEEILHLLGEDNELKQICRALDGPPFSCLLGLLPSFVFVEKKRPGHQLKGVLWQHCDVEVRQVSLGMAMIMNMIMTMT